MNDKLPAKAQNIILDGSLTAHLRADIEDLFTVVEVVVPPHEARGTIIFRGDLLLNDSEVAYGRIAERWRRQDYTPLLRRGKQMIELVAQPGVVKPKPSDPRINLVLFLVTLVSVLLVGALNEGAKLLETPTDIVVGLPFALSFLAILGAHEFGHYFMARYHRVAVTLPYFIPFPTIWGTLGAFIQLRSPTITRKQLFDVGVAGPLAGLVVALPVLVIGLLNSQIEPLPVGGPYLLEGNSLFYWLMKFWIFGRVLPADGVDVILHPLAWAGWSGLFVTAINLLPVGQLDGGHVAYVLFGRSARMLGYAMTGLMIILGIFFWQGWLFWALIIFFLVGVGHPPPLNDLAPVGPGRRALAFLTILIFILLFTPTPIALAGAG